MKISLLLFLVWLATAVAAPPDIKPALDWSGKTMMIKTSREGSTCIRIVDFAPEVGQPDKTNVDAASFKIAEGTAPGTLTFESVTNPGFFLQHNNYHLVLLKGVNDNALFRIVPALRGNLGNSLRSYNYPTYYIALVDKEHLDIVKDIKEPKRAIFYLEERQK